MDYRVELTYDDAVRIAKELAAADPHNVTRHAYFLQSTTKPEPTPYCIVSRILEAAGFKAPQEWWKDQRYDGKVFDDGKDRKRYNTHIRFLHPEIFSNEDLARDAFLTTLQTRQDSGTPWARAVRNSEAYTTRLINHPNNREHFANA